MEKSKNPRTRFLRYSLTVVGVLTLMAIYPPLDPTSYLPYYTRCARISEQEATDIARNKIARSRFLETSLGEAQAAIQTAPVVQIVDWRPSDIFTFSVVFQTAGNHLVEVSVTPECGTRIMYPGELLKPI